ncbi:MAG: pyruvate kinase [Armatimonadetes bacterium]|nr:MAG: pyruvate kinase [Armatimonadota bacterium]
MRCRTKIVCTLGPASRTKTTIAELIEAGMSVARLNCSHGDWDDRLELLRILREESARLDRSVCTLLDLSGPKFRLGTVRGGELYVVEGNEYAVGEGPEEIPIQDPAILDLLTPGQRVLIGDGEVVFKVSERTKDRIRLVSLTGGIVRSRKGITLPGTAPEVPSLTDKDREDLARGVQAGVDAVAMSFVRRADDILEVEKELQRLGAKLPIFAKIEMRAAVHNIEEILDASDGIMVARGDLGLQMPIEDVPIVQKRIIALCRSAGKPVITATQMMESMVEAPSPTRAEATDVANAILDGTDAVMLSGETAYGKFPVQAVRYMARIARKVEKSREFSAAMSRLPLERPDEATESVAHAAATMAAELRPKAILTFSTSGFTARMVAKYRPPVPILCATYLERTARQVSMVWGVRPLITQEFTSTEQMIQNGFRSALEQGLLKSGDLVVITAGLPVGKPGTTNMVTVLQVSENPL